MFKIFKTNPYLASLWQYFLTLCNYQDPEYWLLSLEDNQNKSNSKESKAKDANDLCDSSCSSTNASLPHTESNQKESDLNQLCSAKILTSKIRSKHIYTSALTSKSINEDEDTAVQQNYDYQKNPCLNEQLFKYLSITIYCDFITTPRNPDNTTGLTMILINNIVELFELSLNEPHVWDIFSTIHRNASASSLFIHSINSNWASILSRRKLSLLHSCLKSLEGIHLSSSGHLLNLLIDKYFNLPYLSLVRYADHIACQRVEMMQSLSHTDLLSQLNEQNVRLLNKFFDEQTKYSFRHQRLVLLLEQLKRIMENPNEIIVETMSQAGSPGLGPQTPGTPTSGSLKTSPSIDFFMLYVASNKSSMTGSTGGGGGFSNLDKEWYYNIVRSACCSSVNNSVASTESLISDNSYLKSKQCALMLSNLDYSNCLSILNVKGFKLNILNDCLLLGALRSQSSIEKLPSALKKAATSNNFNIQMDFMHPLWLASTSFLFSLLNNLCIKLPKPPQVSITTSSSSSVSFSTLGSSSSYYESKLDELEQKFDVYSYIAPINESINAYLKCIRQYPCLQNQLSSAANSNDKINDLITYIVFQIEFINYLSTKKQITLTQHTILQSFLCVFNLLSDQLLHNTLTQHSTYSTLVSHIIKNIYSLIKFYYFKMNDENLVHTPKLSNSQNIDYYNSNNGSRQVYTNDVLFTTKTFDIF